MADEGFREIQLSGKQLIALFMTVAVVLVATFLCGVMVGRGVRAQREPASATDAVQAAGGSDDPTAAAAAPQSAPKAALEAPPAAPPPPPEQDPAFYAQGKGGAQAAGEGTAVGAQAKEAVRPPSATPPPAVPAAAAGSEPAGDGFFVKVVAYRDKAQADARGSRLSAKGYGAYAVQLPGKAPALYSVRVGKFKTRKEADAAKRRLEKEEQFKPLVTR